MPILETHIRFPLYGLNQKNGKRMSASQDEYALICGSNHSCPHIADYIIMSVGVGVSRSQDRHSVSAGRVTVFVNIFRNPDLSSEFLFNIALLLESCCSERAPLIQEKIGLITICLVSDRVSPAVARLTQKVCSPTTTSQLQVLHHWP